MFAKDKKRILWGNSRSRAKDREKLSYDRNLLSDDRYRLILN